MRPNHPRPFRYKRTLYRRTSTLTRCRPGHSLAMSTCKVAGYDVSFPHQAYGPQLGYMYKVLKVRTTETRKP